MVRDLLDPPLFVCFLDKPDVTVGIFDALTYAASPKTIESFQSKANYRFFRGDICEPQTVREAIAEFMPDAVMHLAAESHVDRSIEEPAAFVRTNVVGTHVLLDSVLAYWQNLPSNLRDRFRFHHISTDEVFGSLDETSYFTEETRYDPRSPYSASKAASDHIVRAWHHTFGLPVVITNCSNNYGPYQFPEKLVPLMILRGLRNESMPVYGDGENVRDWIHVEDHADALWCVLTQGRAGETYAIGGSA